MRLANVKILDSPLDFNYAGSISKPTPSSLQRRNYLGPSAVVSEEDTFFKENVREINYPPLRKLANYDDILLSSRIPGVKSSFFQWTLPLD